MPYKVTAVRGPLTSLSCPWSGQESPLRVICNFISLLRSAFPMREICDRLRGRAVRRSLPGGAGATTPAKRFDPPGQGKSQKLARPTLSKCICTPPSPHRQHEHLTMGRVFPEFFDRLTVRHCASANTRERRNNKGPETKVFRPLLGLRTGLTCRTWRLRFRVP